MPARANPSKRKRGRRFFAAVLAGVEANGVQPDWAAVAFTIAVTVDDRRVPVLRGYPAAAARGQRLTLLRGSWRASLPAVIAERLEHRLAVLPGMPPEQPASKIPIPVDGRFGDVQAKLIVEAANHPVVLAADEILQRRGVEVIPDIIANAGGVVVSYFEWTQNIQHFRWTEDRVNEELAERILGAYREVRTEATERGLTLREAAFTLAVERVAKAIRLRGFV